MIAIHNGKDGFHPEWVKYSKENNIPHKIVDCYSNNLIQQLEDCHALMWHFSQNNPKDILISKQILFSLQQSGMKVFPDFNTMWHFDDKLGQKYLLESLKLPFVQSYAFYTAETAISWAEKTTYPKVFKLRGGAGSTNVRLVENKKSAIYIINTAFGPGFSNYDRLGSFKESWRLYKLSKISIITLLKSALRMIIQPKFSEIMGMERGYVYFQDYIPGNDSDIRVVVIADKAFAIKRLVRKGDFRASGSGHILYEKALFDEVIIKLAFNASQKLKSQCIAFDFVYQDGNPLIIEISYGFAPHGYRECVGYWDSDMNWFEGKFDPYSWMLDLMLDEKYIDTK